MVSFIIEQIYDHNYPCFSNGYSETLALKKTLKQTCSFNILLTEQY